MMANDMPPLMRIAIVASSVTVWHFVTDDEVRCLSNTVCDHDRRPLLAFPTGKPAKCGAEIRPLRMARRMGAFDEDRPKHLGPLPVRPLLRLPALS
jgi:hypothetical protein